jgi:hypothetical protein
VLPWECAAFFIFSLMKQDGYGRPDPAIFHR